MLGTITKTQGFNGAVIVRSGSNYPVLIKKIESVFLMIEGKPVPFFIEDFEAKGPSSVLLKIEGYNTQDSVKEFIGKEVLLARGESVLLRKTATIDLKGFIIISEAGKVIGTVRDVAEINGQILITVAGSSAEEILIPLHDDLIESIDEKGKIIRMIIPEGLEELNA